MRFSLWHASALCSSVRNFPVLRSYCPALCLSSLPSYGSDCTSHTTIYNTKTHRLFAVFSSPLKISIYAYVQQTYAYRDIATGCQTRKPISEQQCCCCFCWFSSYSTFRLFLILLAVLTINDFTYFP